MSKSAQSDFDWRGAAAPERFMALNQDRLSRVYDSLTTRQRDFLDALPLMFHNNHAALPGYIGKDAPVGITRYSPSPTAVTAARRINRTFEADRRMPPRVAIQGLYMMGSPGTIAYSRHSDLDMWLMHDPELDAAGILKLQKKGELIEQYAATLGLEVHFFVFDAERFRRGEDLSLSDESSGSSQHYLLLDEFYRSGLLVAGLPPLWWSVPARHDDDYDNFVAGAVERGLIDRWSSIDFGALPTIPAEEFFGAAVWQLYKSIHAPYKSVLKLLLMEAYAADYPRITLLSTHFKRNVESDNVDLDAVDPYILMYNKVSEYLTAEDDRIRLEVLRRSFYLKANVPISDRRAVGQDWRAAVVKSMIKDWGWSPAQVERLDRRDEWGLAIALEERRDLTRTFKTSYARLSKFAREHASDSKISKQDLHVLGRKLYVAFEKKPSKIEVITRGICPDPVEQRLSLHEVRIESGKYVWLLFSGTVTPAEASVRQPIKRSGSAAEIVLWCYLNELSNAATTWHVFTTNSTLSAVDIKRINEMVASCLIQQSTRTVNEDLNVRRRIARVALLVNVGINPFGGSISGGDVLTTNAGDPLIYGGRGMNLIRTVDLLFMTSWNEVFAFHYAGSRAILEAVAECLEWVVNERADRELPSIKTRCFSVDCSTQIASRVDEMFSTTLRAMTTAGNHVSPGFIMQAQQQLHHLKFVQGQPVLESYNNQALMMRALGNGSDPDEQAVRFDRGCGRAGFMPTLYALNRPGCIQIFAHKRGARADVYVLDERGFLLVDRQECHAMPVLLQHYRRFLETALPRCQEASGGGIGVQTYEVLLLEDKVKLKAHDSEAEATPDFLGLHVLADADSNGNQQFTVYTGDREFSTWEHGINLFAEVAAYVLAQRAAREAYPIYITDLDLSMRFRQSVGVGGLRPFDLLNYKKRIEYQLTKAMLKDQGGTRQTLKQAS